MHHIHYGTRRGVAANLLHTHTHYTHNNNNTQPQNQRDRVMLRFDSWVVSLCRGDNPISNSRTLDPPEGLRAGLIPAGSYRTFALRDERMIVTAIMTYLDMVVTTIMFAVLRLYNPNYNTDYTCAPIIRGWISGERKRPSPASVGVPTYVRVLFYTTPPFTFFIAPHARTVDTTGRHYIVYYLSISAIVARVESTTDNPNNNTNTAQQAGYTRHV